MSLKPNIKDLSKNELMEENHHLHKDIEDLNNKLNKVNMLLNNAEALKSHFISNITNEIVNPFTSIIGLTENLQNLQDGEIAQAKEMGELIYKEASNLNYQLNNIFAAAKLEAGLFHVERVESDIHQLVSEVLDSFKIELKEKAIEIHTEFTPSEAIHVIDKEKFRIIISNLLNNAIKYSKLNGSIIIVYKQRDETFEIEVKDKGIGINTSQLAEIFDRFKQLDPEINSINKGYGLGLSVTKACLDMMEGDIQIVSEEGIGSEFKVTLPLRNKEDSISEEDFLFDEDGIF